MGYDRFPELLIDEKERFLVACLDQDTRLLLTHDPASAICGVSRDERGRFSAVDQVATVQGLLINLE